MKPTKIFFSGMGRMGKEILALAQNDNRWTVTGYSARTAKADISIPFVDAAGFEAGHFEADVVIDFSNPTVLKQLLKLARHRKMSVVCGTTGLDDGDFEILKDTASYAPILWAANMSEGICVLRHAMLGLKAISGYDFRIEEFHHNKKLDNPSGTALSLHAVLEGVVGRSIDAPVGIRGGGIFGIHSVLAMGQEETLEFKHTALNRTVFARGALRAAEWLRNRPAGYYSMDDVMNLTVKA
jgi:4-hydroxy-tetrahydrodipicolinate reductase